MMNSINKQLSFAFTYNPWSDKKLMRNESCKKNHNVLIVLCPAIIDFTFGQMFSAMI